MERVRDVTDCQVYDNKKIGITIGEMNGKAKLRRNEIFHNDRHGIYLCKKSSAIIEENEIFENGFLGTLIKPTRFLIVSVIHYFSTKVCRII